MSDRYYILPLKLHYDLARDAYLARGFDAAESEAAAHVAEMTARHGIRTHNLIKALHLDDLFGSKGGGCAPRAQIAKPPGRYKAVETWNANRKLGQAVA